MDKEVCFTEFLEETIPDLTSIHDVGLWAVNISRNIKKKQKEKHVTNVDTKQSTCVKRVLKPLALGP